MSSVTTAIVFNLTTVFFAFHHSIFGPLLGQVKVPLALLCLMAGDAKRGVELHRPAL